MAKNKTLMNIHAQKYIEQVFADRLREEGFFCPNDKYLCWYKVIDEQVVHSIVFFTRWSAMPMILEIGYGCYPLFQKPVYTPSVYFDKRPLNTHTFHEQLLKEENPPGEIQVYRRYSEDILVDAPPQDGKGIYTLDKIILPQMKGIKTVEDCYRFHKRQCESILKLNFGEDDLSTLPLYFEDYPNMLQPTFIDEALYFEDTQFYPPAIMKAEKMIERRKDTLLDKPNDVKAQKELQEWELRISALEDGDHNAYLEILEKRRLANIAYLKKLK